MTEIPRLNGVIKALEAGRQAFSAFVPMDIQTALAIAGTKYDSVVFEGEHLPWDVVALRDAMQFMLDRRAISASGSIAPSVTPFARVPVNGVEKGQWHAKQVLDTGCYGVVWPHISTVEEAYNAVAACRYPRRKDKPLYEPKGIRGDGPVRAARYWGLTQQEYYAKADVWPLDPVGEIFVILQIEDTEGIENLPDMLKNVPGIGAILIGEGDLGQELGFPRQYDHPELLDAKAQIVDTCMQHDMVVGHPHANSDNMQELMDQGYRFLMTAPGRTYTGLDKALELTARI
ncbi:MAG: aldolase/citrate lyase family protein [Pseudomonadota bacterium]|nr:aldolase/citrate lyase family protein [Pseudomonadota bacterium]